MRYGVLAGVSFLGGCVTMPVSTDGGTDLSVPPLDLAQPRDQSASSDLATPSDMSQRLDILIRGDCPDGSTLHFSYADMEQCTGIGALIGEGPKRARENCTAGKCP